MADYGIITIKGQFQRPTIVNNNVTYEIQGLTVAFYLNSSSTTLSNFLGNTTSLFAVGSASLSVSISLKLFHVYV